VAGLNPNKELRVKPMRQRGVVRTAILAALLAIACNKQAPTTASSFSAAAAAAGIPELEAYERNMRQYGSEACQKDLMQASSSYDARLAATYYDGERVMLQIADYLRDESFKACAAEAKTTYRDSYVMRPDLMGQVPGNWIFPTGMYLDYKSTSDPRSKQAVIALSRRGAFCAASNSNLARTALSREVAYCGLTYIQSEQMGEPRLPRRDELFNYMFAHLRAWIDASPDSRAPQPYTASPRCAGKPYVQPFMVGLTLHSLIQLYSFEGDPRVPGAVKEAVDWLWEKHWVAADQSFVYENCLDGPGAAYPQQRGAPDLNLLIAPAFAWVYMQTGDDKYRDRGDAVFAGGVTRAWLGNAKQFNQNYMWSPDYVRWRGGTPGAP
jgi:hypothetical protein